MSNFAAQFLVAFSVATQGANAVTACAADYTAKTNVDDKHCSTDAESCSMDPTCCAPKLCRDVSIACDADAYNEHWTATTDYRLIGSDGEAACCLKKATCATATCLGQDMIFPNGRDISNMAMQKDTTKSDDLKCRGGDKTCGLTCCKPATGTCWAWSVAGNTCDAGSSILWSDMYSKGSDKAACCTADVMCDTHICSGKIHMGDSVLKANAKDLTCADAPGTAVIQGQCTYEKCCEYKSTTCKSTTCCGAAVSCGTNMYQDRLKHGVTFTDKAKDCCTTRAQCKDSVLTAEPKATTSASCLKTAISFWSLLSAFSMLGFVLRN